MLQVSGFVGLDRLGAWHQRRGFTPRGRYESRDPMAGVGRVADWIECSCLFGSDSSISKTDVIDEFVGSGILQPDKDREVEDIAESVVDDAFAEMRRRAKLMSTAPSAFPFRIEGPVVRRTVGSWTDGKWYGFLVLLSMGHLATWLRTSGTSQYEAGHLFEEFVRHAAEGLFGKPSVILETSKAGDNHLQARMRDVLAAFGRDTTDELSAAPDRVVDGGLDVVIRLWTSDPRPGGAHFLVQCASGGDWETKLGNPKIAKWREWVRWRGPIYGVIAVPFSFVDDARLHDASRDGEWTLVLDRSRLMYGLDRANSVPPKLASDIDQWCAARLPDLQTRGLIL
jgi:hypothetical protein